MVAESATLNGLMPPSEHNSRLCAITYDVTFSSASRSPGTATKISVAPISIPAALGSITGRIPTLFRFLGTTYSLSAPRRRPGPCKKVVSQTRSSASPSERRGHHCIGHGAQNHTAGRACKGISEPAVLTANARDISQPKPLRPPALHLFLALSPRPSVWRPTAGGYLLAFGTEQQPHSSKEAWVGHPSLGLVRLRSSTPFQNALCFLANGFWGFSFSRVCYLLVHGLARYREHPVRFSAAIPYRIPRRRIRCTRPQEAVGAR